MTIDQNPPCRAALVLVGQHFPCDWPTDADGKHDGWAHASSEAEAIWCGDEGPHDPAVKSP